MQVTRRGDPYMVTPVMVSIEGIEVEVHLAKRPGKSGMTWVEYAVYNNMPLKPGMPTWDAVVEAAKLGKFNEFLNVQ
jgi:hypothetical protein